MSPRLAWAFGLPVAALALQLLLWPWLEPFAWLTFFPALALAARLSGYVGGLVATVVSALLAWYFFMPPAGAWAIDNPAASAWSVAMFVLVGYLVSEMQRRVERARRRSARALDEAIAARDQLAKFSRAIEQTDSTVMITDATGVIEYVNPRFSVTSGYAREEAVGRPASLLKSGLTPGAVYRELWETITRGAVWKGELRNRRKDGSLYWECAIVSPVRDDEGRITHFVAVKDDYTARKEAEAALRRSEERFRRLFDRAPVPLGLVEPDGTVAALNGRFVELFGYTLDDLHTLDDWWRLAYPDSAYRARVLENWSRYEAQMVLGSHIDAAESRVRCKDGTVRHVIAAGITFEEGFMATFFDVTERRQAERALREHQQRLAGIVESAMDAVIATDQAQRISLFNPAAQRMFGLPAEKAIGQPLARLIPARFRESHREHMEQFATGEAGARRMGGLREVSGLRADGKEFPLEASISQVRVDGGVQMTVILRDIGERKRTEAAVRELRAEMEQLLTLHVASQTAAAIAHELNQPLNAIASYTGAAQRMLDGGEPDPVRLRRALEGSDREAQRAGRVVRELLAFLHKGETVSEAVDLNGAVRSALSIVESDGYSGFHAQVELSEGLRPVLANRIQIEKVLVTLICNAVEAMRLAGIATQRVLIVLRTADEDDMAQVTIKDVGPGIDAATAQRIFEPFFTTKPNGIGMGLAIGRSLVEAHGGRLWIDPPGAGGATFHFTLPYATQQ